MGFNLQNEFLLVLIVLVPLCLLALQDQSLWIRNCAVFIRSYASGPGGSKSSSWDLSLSEVRTVTTIDRLIAHSPLHISLHACKTSPRGSLQFFITHMSRAYYYVKLINHIWNIYLYIISYCVHVQSLWHSFVISTNLSSKQFRGHPEGSPLAPEVRNWVSSVSSSNERSSTRWIILNNVNITATYWFGKHFHTVSNCQSLQVQVVPSLELEQKLLLPPVRFKSQLAVVPFGWQNECGKTLWGFWVIWENLWCFTVIHLPISPDAQWSQCLFFREIWEVRQISKVRDLMTRDDPRWRYTKQEPLSVELANSASCWKALSSDTSTKQSSRYKGIEIEMTEKSLIQLLLCCTFMFIPSVDYTLSLINIHVWTTQLLHLCKSQTRPLVFGFVVLTGGITAHRDPSNMVSFQKPNKKNTFAELSIER